jgi:hypothetical protein
MTPTIANINNDIVGLRNEEKRISYNIIYLYDIFILIKFIYTWAISAAVKDLKKTNFNCHPN